MKNKTGPKSEPWGTSLATSRKEEVGAATFLLLSLLILLFIKILRAIKIV